MEITSAEFVISNTDVKKCPTGVFPEYAFIGRSNVGKSSLINMLTARKGLAMTSATPGKTMLINHFLINQSWYLVDLPGYGYARRGQKGKDQIRTIIEDYILEREQMTNLFVLIDSLFPDAFHPRIQQFARFIQGLCIGRYGTGQCGQAVRFYPHQAHGGIAQVLQHPLSDVAVRTPAVQLPEQ